jgi:sigma-B regulation protein RsbU (phosphoserine phosphatase)
MSSEQAILESQELESTAQEAERRTSTILLVDDEKLARMVARRRLERMGHTVIEAENGCQGLEVLRQQSIDMVISDWMMPEMDGPTFCEQVKADEHLKSKHFILMTALDQPDQIAEGLSRGADDFLAKSATDQEITARINAGIRTCKLIQSLGESYELIAQQQAELNAELVSAAEFVTSLLPPMGEPTPGIHVEWEYRPSSQVGGDLFQVTPWGKDHLGLMILDISGHGIKPALRAVSLSMSFRSEHIERLHPTFDPAEILIRLNHENPMREDGMYFTTWVGCLHLPTRELRYATAGHPATILTRNGGIVEELGANSCPIGFGMNDGYVTQSKSLQVGDRLFLFSDGIYEVMSADEQLWGRDGLATACQSVHGKPLKKSLSWLVQQAKVWQCQETFGDDVALVALEIES